MLPHRQQPTRLLRPWDSPGKNTGVGCHFLLQCMKVKCESEVAQSFPTLRNPMDCSPPGSSIHGIFPGKGTGVGCHCLLRQVVLVVKNLPANAVDIRDSGSIPGSGRSPEEGNGNPLQYSCLENPMGKGAWWAAVHGLPTSRTQLNDFTFTLTFMHWRRKWQPTPVFLPGESQGRGSLVGCCLWGSTESDTTEAT